MKHRKNGNKRPRFVLLAQEIDRATEDAAKLAALATDAELQIEFEKREDKDTAQIGDIPSLGNIYLEHFYGVLTIFLQKRCAMDEKVAKAQARRSIAARMAALGKEEELREKTEVAFGTDAGKNDADSDGNNTESVIFDKNNPDHAAIVEQSSTNAFLFAGAARETVRSVFLEKRVQIDDEVFDEALDEIFDTHFVEIAMSVLKSHLRGIDTEIVRKIALKELDSINRSIAYVRGPSEIFLSNRIMATLESMSDSDMRRLKTVAIAMMGPENPIREKFDEDLRMRHPPSGRPPSGH